MNEERRKRVLSILADALDQQERARPAFLDEACAGDADVRAEVEALLAADAEAGSFLDNTASRDGEVTLTASERLPRGATAPERAEPQIAERVGKYKLTREIASGGMGTVYEAIQERPRRTVAVKVIKRGMVSRGLLKRFEYESQMLGRLRHPGIAQVFEAGIHRDDAGAVPYFAMEYIPNAKSLTEFAEQQKLGTRERLELFATVCDAVHHGHQKGVIHRDLKPSNILVDEAGRAKIIDFGVARSTDSDVAVTTMQTDVGQLIGTLQYMSPEQCLADPHDLDTRSDVYALGVVMFELLCGRVPYDVKGQPLHEVTRTIREQPPTRLSTVNRTLRGDVETIALKALEKERERRYQSAAGLAADIRGYLNNEPISARPPSMIYHVRVFARRNKALVGAVAAVFAVLVGASIVSTSQYLKAERARVEEKKSATTATEIRNVVLEKIVDLLGNSARREPDIGPRGLLDRFSDDVTKSILTDELTKATLHVALAWEYALLGDAERAHDLIEPALQTRRTRLGENDWDTLRAMQVKGRVLALQNRPDEAVQTLRRSIEGRWELERQDSPDVQGGKIRYQERHFTQVLLGQKKYVELEKFALEARAQRRVKHGDNFQYIGMPTGWLCTALEGQGRVDDVETVRREFIESIRRFHGEDAHQTLWATSALRDAFVAHGKIEEARPHTVEVIARAKRFTEAADADARSLNRYAMELLTCEPQDLRDPQAALPAAQRAVEMTEGKNAEILDTLALAYFMTGDLSAAIETQEKAVTLLSPGESELRMEREANLEKYRVAARVESSERANTETEVDVGNH